MSNGITMKKALMICLAVFLMFGVSIDAKAATKAPSKEEVQLQQLIAYRDALVLQGASQADVDYANKAIALVQAQVAAQNGAAAQTAAQAQAQQAALSQQQAALAQQQAQAAAIAQQRQADIHLSPDSGAARNRRLDGASLCYNRCFAHVCIVYIRNHPHPQT